MKIRILVLIIVCWMNPAMAYDVCNCKGYAGFMAVLVTQGMEGQHMPVMAVQHMPVMVVLVTQGMEGQRMMAMVAPHMMAMVAPRI